jgi:formiminotetrahydrofolate cyclodeaminase
MYGKSILITQNKRLEQFIKHMMKNRKMEIETELPLLSNINKIREDIHRNNNTVNLRAEFGYFIKTYGFPFMLILDYQVDFSLSLNSDPDQRKLVRTFLLAFTLLANSKGFENATANIVFIVNKKQFIPVSKFTKNPTALLTQIRTKDERINAIIDAFTSDDEKVKRFFHISYIFEPENGKYAQEVERLEKIIDIFKNIIESIPEPETQKTGTEMITDKVSPADVICRATLEKMIVNGEISHIKEEEKHTYLEKNIHLVGALTQKTTNTVKDRITTTFKVMAKCNPFKKDERIFINIPDSSVLDGSFAVSIGTYLSQELSEYTGISLNIGKANHDKLKNSKGYFAIEDYIMKNL